MRTKTKSLRELRIDENKKQIEVCNDLNVARNTYSQYETGKRQMPISLIPKLAEILNCSIEEIVYCFCD